MYRNNYRPPQMAQPFGNRGSGMQKPCQVTGNSCGNTPQTQPANDCGCASAQGNNCGNTPQTLPVNDCGRPQCCASAQENNCGCGNEKPDSGCFPSKEDPVAKMALAMAYVPWQDYKNIFSEEEAWCKGTIFAQLDLDFTARRCN